MTTPIVLIVGAPASGKSTASRGLAARFARSIAINVDDLRSMVVAGVVHPGAVWTDELVEQLNLARQSAVAMALRYHAAGFAVVIDDFYDPASRLREYDDLAGAGLVRVLLYPDAQKAHAQNLQRSGPGPVQAYLDDGIRIVYAELGKALDSLQHDGWIVLDTTDDSPAQTVDRLVALVAPKPGHL